MSTSCCSEYPVYGLVAAGAGAAETCWGTGMTAPFLLLQLVTGMEVVVAVPHLS